MSITPHRLGPIPALHQGVPNNRYERELTASIAKRSPFGTDAAACRSPVSHPPTLVCVFLRRYVIWSAKARRLDRLRDATALPIARVGTREAERCFVESQIDV